MKIYYYLKFLYFPLALFLLMSFFIASCYPSLNRELKIDSVIPTDPYVYPQGTSEIKCTASDISSTNLTYKWSCTEGIFEGNGPVVTWKAPNQYGKFNIMVVVEDDKGNCSQATTSISVVVNENPGSCCGR
jgi:hypothetical protein